MAAPAYPPPVHLLSDIGLEAETESTTTSRARTRVGPHLCGADGGMRPGVVATLVDVVGGAVVARNLGDDWMATSDLTVQMVRPARGPFVEATATVLRRGKTTLVLEALVTGGDDDPDPVAWAAMTFAVLPGRSPDLALGTQTGIPGTWSISGAGLVAPVVETLDIEVTDAAAGAVSMPVVPYVHNSIGAVQGGVMALVAEVAGEAALSSALGGVPVAVTDLHVVYLALGRLGPIVSQTRVLAPGEQAGRAGTPAGCDRAVVELLDAGADGRLTTVVNVGAAPVEIPAPATRATSR